jgi:bifunctional non-homologous end joining protein LigD
MTRLEEYRRKRRFDRTPEPAGEGPRRRGQAFVVQKHAARRLHYDFRLEIDGVLKSWAVPKGPSLSPADKRLAVQTEDHPLEYAHFEGVIPEGSYGAGTVMVWDRGTYELEGLGSASEQVARGEIKFNLHGEKLRGGFVLVKLRRSEKGNEWLLIKHKDAFADPKWSIEEHDGSVLTGRLLEEISKELPPKTQPRPIAAEELEGARKAAMPSRIEPMLAISTDQPFSDPGWLFEIKWDGVRALCRVMDGRIEIHSRTGRVMTEQYPELEALPGCLGAKQAILDGEIVVLDKRGHSDFECLQERMHVRAPSARLLSKSPVTCYIFDLLYSDGYDLRESPLVQRKELLRRLLDAGNSVRYSDHQPEHGKELFELAREQGLEGIIAKHAHSPYVSGRSPYWVKLKARKELDAVVGGWTEPRGSREYFGALLLGLYQGKNLRFIGHVGTGFNQANQKVIHSDLSKQTSSACPFEAVPETNEKAYWVKPRLVARVQYSGWTQERRLREPVFVGLRADANPEDCQFENEVGGQASPTVAMAPAIAGRVLTKQSQIEAELSKGHAENTAIEMDGKRLRLTNLNKIYFPEPGYTKRNLLAYYYRIAGRLLPFLRDRPLVLRRYPDGISGHSFFQKEAGEIAPEWMETVAIPSEEKREEIHYILANDLAALLFLTNLGCIDHNPWSSRRDDLEHPDYFFFDLDPSEGTDFSTVVVVAQALSEQLEQLGLKAFLKTSGATGFHLYVPVERVYTYEQLRMFAEIVARLVARAVPHCVTSERSVAKRPPGKIYIDVSQNAYGRPLATAYVVRPFPQAPISTPVKRAELRRTLRPKRFNLKTIFARLREKGDLWSEFPESCQRIEKALRALSVELPAPRKR